MGEENKKKRCKIKTCFVGKQIKKYDKLTIWSHTNSLCVRSFSNTGN